MHQTTGLRERKKAATRAALSQAAVRLALDHGADAVTADAIARSASFCAVSTSMTFWSRKRAANAASIWSGMTRARCASTAFASSRS